MEVAGTAIATVGIVGLFNTALEVFDYVQSAAAFGSTHEVLQVKIEVEKVRLLIWGQGIGLDGSADQRDDAVNEALDREYLRTAVAGLLVCFVKILEDSEGLRDRYGLVQRADPGTVTGMEMENLDQRLLRLTFKRTYDKFRGNPSGRQRDSTLALRMRWAVADERRFRRLVEQLKAINDSLNHLLPTIRDKTRALMRTEILKSTDEHQLQNLVNASDDVNDPVSGAASLRLEMLSGRGVSIQPNPATVRNRVPARRPVSISQPGPSAQTSRSSTAVAPDAPVSEPLATETTAAPAQVAPAPPRPASPPIAAPAPTSEPKRLPIPAVPPYDNTGALVVHKVFSGAGVPSFFSWQVNVEDLGQLAPKRESTLNIAFDMFRIPSNLLHCCQRLLEIDLDADPEYPGWAPASVSLKGFSGEYGFKRLQDTDTPPKEWLRAAGTPSVSLDDLLKRWNEISAAGGLGTKWTEEIGHQQVRNLLGSSEVAWLDPKEAVKSRHQISDLLASLSRKNVFPAFEAQGGSVGALALRGVVSPNGDYRGADFLYHMLHAKELSLRLEREKGHWHGGITRKIIYDMIAAELWMRNIEVKTTDGVCGFEIRMDVRQRQVDAMISFAEKMEWPFIAEARKTLNDFLHSGKEINPRTWDWVAGLTLPGSFFPLTLMFGLHQASPSLNKTTPSGVVQSLHGNFGLVFPQISYWHSRSIIGRVLAVVPKIHEMCGWVGPCISPTGLETYRTPAALVQVHTRAPAFKLKDSAGEQQPFVPSDGRLTWEEPVLPPVPQEVCVLQKLHMLPVPTDVNPTNPGGGVTAYRAKLDFYLLRANKPITLTLYSNSIFVAAPPCKGTHKIDPKLASTYTRTVYELSQLDKAELKTEGVTVINATGHGAQALARAWCSEKGTNAVIWKRDGECCFKCGLMVAGKEGLDVDVLILC